MINPQWLELTISRANSHGPKDVGIEVLLYMFWVLIRSASTREYQQHTFSWRNKNTLQPLYNMVLYNMVLYNTVLDITRFKDGSQKCIDYIEK